MSRDKIQIEVIVRNCGDVTRHVEDVTHQDMVALQRMIEAIHPLGGPYTLNKAGLVLCLAFRSLYLFKDALKALTDEFLSNGVYPPQDP